MKNKEPAHKSKVCCFMKTFYNKFDTQSDSTAYIDYLDNKRNN